MGNYIPPATDTVRGIDDFLNGIATQIKTMDLRNFYRGAGSVKNNIRIAAQKLWDATNDDIPLPNGERLIKEEIKERVLYIGIEPGVINRRQMIEFWDMSRELAQKFGGQVKLVIQEIDFDVVR